MSPSPVTRRRGAGRKPPTVSVLTPTIPGRERLLRECVASVRAQTFTSWEHLVVLDAAGDGCSRTMNRAASAAVGEWLVPLADDDFLAPGALGVFLDASEGADVVYAHPLVWGEPPDQFCGEPPHMGSCALIRSALWGAAGGYNESLTCREDQDLWQRLLGQPHQATFRRATGGPTLIYRFWHENGRPGNKSRR